MEGKCSGDGKASGDGVGDGEKVMSFAGTRRDADSTTERTSMQYHLSSETLIF